MSTSLCESTMSASMGDNIPPDDVIDKFSDVSMGLSEVDVTSTWSSEMNDFINEIAVAKKFNPYHGNQPKI